MLPPSGLITVVFFSFIHLNEFLFTTLWSVLRESTTRSCSVASLEALSVFRLEVKLPGCVPVAFFVQVCTRWPFCLQKEHSAFSFITLRFHVAFHAAAVAC